MQFKWRASCIMISHVHLWKQIGSNRPLRLLQLWHTITKRLHLIAYLFELSVLNCFNTIKERNQSQNTLFIVNFSLFTKKLKRMFYIAAIFDADNFKKYLKKLKRCLLYWCNFITRPFGHKNVNFFPNKLS